MALSNLERVGKALDLLRVGLWPYMSREFTSIVGASWEDALAKSGELPELHKAQDGKNWNWDVKVILAAMWTKWNDVFKKTLGQGDRSIVSELREVRKKWAHQEPFSSDDTYRALDSVERLLKAVSAIEAAEVEKLKGELLRTKYEQQMRDEKKKVASLTIDGVSSGVLRPWRELVTPHPDVASGGYQRAEFAADLWQVYLREGSDEYKHPTEFFRRTFLTEGLKQLLKGALLRLSKKGGDPVVELQTNFGGGKTHSMLALYHMFSGASLGELPGLDPIVSDAGAQLPKNVRRAVIVGTRMSPGQPHTKDDGTVVRTLWGEIAWQLGGKEGYKIVEKADETATNPGDAFRTLCNKYSPCLILIDEWVAYARQLHDDGSLPSGTFETQFTFAQALTETVKSSPGALLVLSVPASESVGKTGGASASDIEIGGERGFAALSRLKNAIGRVEAPWRPASSDESFEIVRRRLFQPMEEENFKKRDAVARAFSELYSTQSQEFPSESREGEYERRIRSAYPIHPELFDRLYNDWSTLEKFQRTRGVLRLMAAVIHSLWERQDGSLLIMPGGVPIDDPRVQPELTRYLSENWVPVIERDVDGPHSLPMAIDAENPNLGRHSACRRVARSIYVGSAPVQKAANKGLDDRRIKLGCVQPGESVAVFGDGLRRLSDKATYLYFDGARYWYSTQPTVTRMADDRAAQFEHREGDVFEEIKGWLRKEATNKGDFIRVHACPESGDVVDERDAALVILGPDCPHTAKTADTPASKKAMDILEHRGSSPRTNRNMLVFLAPDSNRLRELTQAVRYLMAWESIVAEKETLDLTPFQAKQAEAKRKSAEDTVRLRLPETYHWLLVPEQPDKDKTVVWTETKLQGQDHLAARASKKLKNDQRITIQWSGVNLKMELDQVPLWRGGHVELRQLADDFAKYVYLPRLRTSSVLLDAVRDGLSLLTWDKESFAHADGYDEKAGRYIGLRFGQNVPVSLDGKGLLVRPDVAAKQFEREKPTSVTGGGTSTTGGEQATSGGDGTTPLPPPAPAKKYLKRFHGTIKLDPARLGRDAGDVAMEVVSHLNAQTDAELEVILEIQARIPAGASEQLVRTVTENCKSLKFINSSFEEE